MTTKMKLEPLSEAALDEHWFSLRLKTWKAVKAAIKSINVDQKELASRIGMDAAQFNKVVSGKKYNVTLRTLHNIARAANHRLHISIVPLSDLPKPNYRFEHRVEDKNPKVISRTTERVDDWTPRTVSSFSATSKALEVIE